MLGYHFNRWTVRLRIETLVQSAQQFDSWFTPNVCVCQNVHVFRAKWNAALQSSISMTCLIYWLHTQLMIFSPLSLPALSSCSHANLPTFLFSLSSHIFFLWAVSLLSLFHSYLSLCVFHQSSSLTLLHVIYLISFVFRPPDLPLHILPLPSLSLRFSGRLLIAVSQYHGGRQRGCRSGGECSTRTAGSHSNVQPWHLGQVRAWNEAGINALEWTAQYVLH